MQMKGICSSNMVVLICYTKTLHLILEGHNMNLYSCQNYIFYASYQAFKSVELRSLFFWDVTLYHLVKRFPTFPHDALVTSSRIKMPNKTVIVFFDIWTIKCEATASSWNIRFQLPGNATTHPRRMDTLDIMST